MEKQDSIETIVINGVTYEKANRNKMAEPNSEGMRYVIVRSQSAGVFAGYLQSLVGTHGVILNARRIWYWSGAASLSQLALEGTKKPDECKFPAEVPRVELTQVIEILDVTEKAKESISKVKVWKQ